MSVTGNGIYAGGGGGVDMVTVDITDYAAATWYIPPNGQHVGGTIITPANSIIVFRAAHMPAAMGETGDVHLVTDAYTSRRPFNYLAVFNVGESGGSIVDTTPIGGAE